MDKFIYCDSNIEPFFIAPPLVIALNLFAIAIVGRLITLEIEPSKKKQRTDTIRMQKGLRVITLQGAIKKR